jgi:hypothetical protein
MITNPQKQGALIDNANAVGTVSNEMLQARVKELSAINGHASDGTLKSDIAQARRELSGGTEMDPKTELLESAPESERWDALPGSSGNMVPSAPSADEDDEGQSDNTKLVKEGIDEAEHDQMLQASKAGAKET